MGDMGLESRPLVKDDDDSDDDGGVRRKKYKKSDLIAIFVPKWKTYQEAADGLNQKHWLFGFLQLFFFIGVIVVVCIQANRGVDMKWSVMQAKLTPGHSGSGIWNAFNVYYDVVGEFPVTPFLVVLPALWAVYHFIFAFFCPSWSGHVTSTYHNIFRWVVFAIYESFFEIEIFGLLGYRDIPSMLLIAGSVMGRSFLAYAIELKCTWHLLAKTEEKPKSTSNIISDTLWVGGPMPALTPGKELSSDQYVAILIFIELVQVAIAMAVFLVQACSNKAALQPWVNVLIWCWFGWKVLTTLWWSRTWAMVKKTPNKHILKGQQLVWNNEWKFSIYVLVDCLTFVSVILAKIGTYPN